jgi:hypothetical protein
MKRWAIRLGKAFDMPAPSKSVQWKSYHRPLTCRAPPYVLQNKKARNALTLRAFQSIGGNRARTCDLLDAIETLSQLSYTPVDTHYRTKPPSQGQD